MVIVSFVEYALVGIYNGLVLYLAVMDWFAVYINEHGYVCTGQDIFVFNKLFFTAVFLYKIL